MALAAVIAVVVFLVVNRVWRGAAPPVVVKKPVPVEVQLVPPVPSPASLPARR